MATHSSILAWRIPIDRGAWWAIKRIGSTTTRGNLCPPSRLQALSGRPHHLHTCLGSQAFLQLFLPLPVPDALLQGIFPGPRIESESLMSPALPGGFFTTSTTWEARLHKHTYIAFECIVALSTFYGKQIEAQRGLVTFPRSHS